MINENNMNLFQTNRNRSGLFNIGTSPKLDLALNKCFYINALDDAFKTGLSFKQY